MSDESNIERRRFKRLPKQSAVVYQELQYPLSERPGTRAEYRDVGAGGLLFDAPRQLKLGSVLRLEISLPGWRLHHPHAEGEQLGLPDRPLTVVGEVVRVIEKEKGKCYEVAVQFTSVFSDEFEALLRFVNSEAPRSDLSS